MRPLTWVLFAILLLVCVFAVRTKADTIVVYPRTTVYALEGDEVTGSGVMIAPGKMLTAAHVTLADKTLKVWFNGKQIPMKVIKQNEDLDLALIKVDIPCPCATIAAHDPVQDQEVIAIGYPYYNMIHAQILTHGNVQGPRENTILAMIAVYPGNSGGGLFTMDGELAGITSRNLPDTLFSLFVPPSIINKFIQ